ncbi:MAG: CoA transferase, partial [Gammaproteobacteria bacterium]|nr:CoA transferase [Gammaproteobacteria bacterium]
MSGPLAGVKILELTSVVLGPWACQMLADLGAEVIKVEPPRGDSNRSLGAYRNPGMAALYLTCNRNKRSIVLNLKDPAARAVALQLVKSVDVVIHNNRPQTMTRLGMDYETLKAINPKLIYCGTYGYG